jgi:hypothetical protein
MKLARNGVIKRLYKEGMPVGTLQSAPRFHQLDFQSVTPLLLVLGTGIILAIFVFLTEIITHKYFAEDHKIIIHRNGRKKALESATAGSVLKGSAILCDKEKKSENESEGKGDFKFSSSSSEKMQSRMQHE